MQKIPTLFVRDPADRAHVLPVVNHECQWVIAGEGTATRKYDGTCVLLDTDGSWWARREVRPNKAAPADYRPVATDPVTGRTMGWEPIQQSAFAAFHAEALAEAEASALDVAAPQRLEPGTFELVGPKINGNPEREQRHRLLAHADAEVVPLEARDYRTLRAVVLRLAEAEGMEGLVFHHPDGVRFAKIKARDFPGQDR